MATMGRKAAAVVTLAFVACVASGGASGRSLAGWVPPAVPPTNVEGYTSEVSVVPGATVHFHVSTEEGEQYRIEVYRLGWYGGEGARLLVCLPSCGGSKSGHRYPPPSFAGGSAGWPVTDQLAIPADWTSGYYYALFRVTSGPAQDVDTRGWAVFIVRELPSHHARILVQVPVNTWQAYNPWGGKSLYDHNSRHCSRASHVSFDRPLAFTAQGPFDWEYNLVRFLERDGYDVSYQTDVDTDIDPDSLLQHRLVIVAGHSEYWTKRMRDAFDAARDAGTNVAFTGSNAAYWQTRYEGDHRTLVVYKNTSDPEPDPALKTVEFQHLVPPRLVVQRPPVVLAHVGLVAVDLVVVRDATGPELDAGVRLGPVADELELHLQLEVAVGLLGAEELVAGHGRLKRPADDGPVLGRPGLLGVAFPPLERLAVEEWR